MSSFLAEAFFACVINSSYETPSKPCPMLLFHGDADSNVPFDKLTMGDAGLYGSLAISESLKELSVNHWFHRFNGADHSVAIDPMVRNKGEIYDFIQAVIPGKVYDMNAVTTVKNGEYKTAFTIRDYIGIFRKYPTNCLPES